MKADMTTDYFRLMTKKLLPSKKDFLVLEMWLILPKTMTLYWVPPMAQITIRKAHKYLLIF